MKPILFQGAALAIVLLLGATARLWHLGERPMHADEAVQGMKFIELLEGEGYRYDPRHFHGPTLYYGALPIAWVRGEGSGPALSEETLRLVPALSGILLACAPLLWWRRLKWTGLLIACSLLAFSPGLVYYSRMYIQESLFVTCVLLALLLDFGRAKKGVGGLRWEPASAPAWQWQARKPGSSSRLPESLPPRLHGGSSQRNPRSFDPRGT